MSDNTTLSVLRIPYPDNISKLSQIEWYALKIRLPEIYRRLQSENIIADELTNIAKTLHGCVNNIDQTESQQLINQTIIKLVHLSEKLKY